MKASLPTLVSACALALLCAAPSPAQVNPSRWGSTLNFGFGYVDRATLANHFEIPIYARAGAGHAQIRLALTYNSNFWGYAEPGDFGWGRIKPFGKLSSTESVWDQYCGWWNDNLGQYDEWYNLVVDSFYLTEPDGTYSGSPANSEYLEEGGGESQLGDEDDCTDVSGSGSVLNPDGKGYTIEVYNADQPGAYAHAFDSQGDQIDGLLQDPSGNQATITSAGGNTYYHDPLGDDANGNPALTESGAGTEASPVVFTYTGPNGRTSITEKFAAQSVTGVCGTWSGSPELPTELDLPDGRKYGFGYDPAGRVNAVTLPTGAVIHYAYTLICNGPDTDNSQLSRWDSVNGAGQGWNWALSQQAGGAVQTTETSPDQNDNVFSFSARAWSGESGALTEADFYQGTGASRSQLESIAYSNTLTDDYVTGQGLTYELYQGGSPVLWRQVLFHYADFGGQLYQYDYDWGACFSCGRFLRNVTTAYTALLGNVMVVPAETTISQYSGSGGQIAQTNYSYDATTGNLQSEKNYVNGTAYLTQSFSYNANGTVATTTDPNGAVTTYGYGGAGGCSDANGRGIFPTLIQSPVSAVKTTASWNCVGGVLASSTDANNNTTTFAYAADAGNDWRPSSVTDAAGNTASLTYPSGGYPGQSESAMTFNGGNSIVDAVTTVDGLGRTILSQRRQGPSSSSYDIEQTSFDAMDRPVTVSAPYQGPLGDMASGAVTTTTYDALSRPLLVTDGDGGTTGYSYTENDVLLTRGPAPGGENTKRKQEEMDGLGRLTSVCELTSTANGGGSCGQNSVQTGYWTRYTLDALGDITAVAQNAQGTAQGRSFSFDWLGRLTAETNPESGTTSYAFDADSTCGTSGGDLVKRLDAAGNTTCYAHDALHRVTQISYSGPNAGATPTKTFQNTLQRALARWTKFDLVAIDELGYLPLAEVGAELLFQVIAERAERASIRITTNLPFSEWPQVFANPRLCKALLDRVTDRCHIIETGAESYRFRRTASGAKKGGA